MACGIIIGFRIGESNVDYKDITERAQKPRSLQHLLALDVSVAKRGVPSLPKLKFMEGPGPERFDDSTARPA
jgi:hypothetical protein